MTHFGNCARRSLILNANLFGSRLATKTVRRARMETGHTLVKDQNITKLMVLSAAVLVVGRHSRRIDTHLQRQTASRFRNSEDEWQLIATSQPDKEERMRYIECRVRKAILGNPAMIKADRDGIPANGKVLK
ncbi:MAG: cytochrome P460 family protein [Acidobacteria bacterium]|nr:cytochrome P460 family protein [Acidobacteriota bacterium]